MPVCFPPARRGGTPDRESRPRTLGRPGAAAYRFALRALAVRTIERLRTCVRRVTSVRPLRANVDFWTLIVRATVASAAPPLVAAGLPPRLTINASASRVRTAVTS